MKPIRRDGAGATLLRSTAPQKITDALDTFLHQMRQALAEDGMDFGILDRDIDRLRDPLTDLVTGANDRLVDTWESVIDDMVELRDRRGGGRL